MSPAPAKSADTAFLAAFDPEVAQAVRAAPPEAEGLALQAALRARLDAPRALAAAQRAHLVRKARGRLPEPEFLALTAKGLEQASAPDVAAARARTMSALAAGDGAARGPVLDGTVGLGADALALARVGFDLVAADRDGLTARCARHNLARWSTHALVVCADLLAPAARTPYLYADLDRRADGRRKLDPAAWSPPFGAFAARLGTWRGAAASLAPAADPAALAALLPAGLPHRWQWVGRPGELLELVLWTGVFAPEGDRRREALVLLPGGGEARFSAPTGETRPAEPLAPGRDPAFVVEPAPPLVRAQLVGPYGCTLDALPLGPKLAFLGTDREPEPSPLHRAWRVLESSALDRRRVRRMLGGHGIGPVRVRARGHPDGPEQLARTFAGRGERSGELLVARLERGHRAYLVEPLPRWRPAGGEPGALPQSHPG